jgi:hypothetical protein
MRVVSNAWALLMLVGCGVGSEPGKLASTTEPESAPDPDGGTTGGEVGPTPAAPPHGAFLVEDFERGPDTTGTAACQAPGFDSRKPNATEACDRVGWNSSSCRSMFYCDGMGFAGLCPDYIEPVEGAWRGGYSLRLYYDIDANNGAFGGLVLHLANTSVDPNACVVDRPPADLTNFDILSLRVRSGDAVGNAEIALKDADGFETNPKAVLTPLGDEPLVEGRWSRVQVAVCDLLQSDDPNLSQGKLNRQSIAKVLVGFAKQRFINEGTDVQGVRQLDIDDVLFVPCATTGCKPCAQR